MTKIMDEICEILNKYGFSVDDGERFVELLNQLLEGQPETSKESYVS